MNGIRQQNPGRRIPVRHPLSTSIKVGFPKKTALTLG